MTFSIPPSWSYLVRDAETPAHSRHFFTNP